jgi:hypothetical protein
MTDAQMITWATIAMGSAAVVAIFLGVIRPLFKQAKKLLNSLNRFTDDWFGQEADSGRDAVPGVMARLNNIDGELKHNGGSTMKDAIKRIEVDSVGRRETLSRIELQLGLMSTRLDEGNKRFKDLDERVDGIEKGTSK